MKNGTASQNFPTDHMTERDDRTRPGGGCGDRQTVGRQRNGDGEVQVCLGRSRDKDGNIALTSFVPFLVGDLMYVWQHGTF